MFRGWRGLWFALFAIADVAEAHVKWFAKVDRLALRTGVLAAQDARMKKFDGSSIWLLRVSGAIFFFSLAAWHLLRGNSFYLTTELLTQAAWVPWLQMAIGACALWRLTAPITGLGILWLYGAAVGDYGVYHLIDFHGN